VKRASGIVAVCAPFLKRRIAGSLRRVAKYRRYRDVVAIIVFI